MSTNDKTVVLVTGCSTQGGIGFSLCEAFASKGCIVFATARRLESMEGFTQDNIHRLKLDVMEDVSVNEVIQTIIEKEGQIDILVNNAGIGKSSPLIDVEMEEIIRIFNTNVFAAIRTAKTVIPYMAARTRHGRKRRIRRWNHVCPQPHVVVSVSLSSSREFARPSPWGGVYAASKAAIHSLTDSLYMECKPLNINVILLAPGAVKSNIATNQALHVHLPPDSLYKDYFDHILERLTLVQENNPMPTEVYAQTTYMSLGKMTGWAKVFQWLPRGWVLDMIWKRFGEGPRKAAQKTK
ncbi:NAD-P-binding protein [Ganoderma leucocontextum]|nr:NAD-P-binding protein [Ganoderma leucocontextum]